MRSRENGLDFREAAVEGTSTMIMSTLAGTLTTVVVYIPLAMAEGQMCIRDRCEPPDLFRLLGTDTV